MNPMMECPIRTHGEELLSSLDEVGRQMRTLRREMRRCKSCPAYLGGCPILADVRTRIDQAILAVNEELGILG